MTAATMSRCSSGLRESPAAAAERIRQFTLIEGITDRDHAWYFMTGPAEALLDGAGGL